MEADSNSFEYFEAVFEILVAYKEYREICDDDSERGYADSVDSQLSENDKNQLLDLLTQTWLWDRVPTDAELKVMVERGEIAETPPKYQISRSQPLRGTIASAGTIFVYEGYLRFSLVQEFPFESFTHENQDFTLPKHKAESNQMDLLRDLFGTDKFFADWRGEKACGAFSADYMIEWDFEGAPVRIMVCTGCYEIIVTYNDQWFKHDFAETKAGFIKEALAQFDQKRTIMRKKEASRTAKNENP